MSTELVKAEIKRFLRSSEAEVLCIKGKWGVGKTFAWLKYLEESEAEQRMGLNKYSYVSLFGVNDLEALRYSVFENTLTAGHFSDSPDIASFRMLLERAGDLARKSKPLFSPILGALGFKDAGDALTRAAFLTVRDQFVCLDDLERRGSDLHIRDVLGLASMLKEQRRCKVVLLLNDERLCPPDKEELERQLEKVVDVSLVFEPTPVEAAAIAFEEGSSIGQKLRPKMIALGVTNIRVMKKVERLAKHLSELLSKFRMEVQDQGIHATALGGWAVLQPDSAPPLDFLRRYNSILAAMKAKEGEKPDNESRWEQVVDAYGWSHCDELDSAIFEGVEAGYFDNQKIENAARQVQSALENDQENNAFSKAWRLYHDSLTTDDDVVLDALYEGAKECVSTMSPSNLSSTALLLREFGRDDQAENLIAAYMSQPDLAQDRLDRDIEMWGGENIDPSLASAFETAKAAFVDTRDPREVLVNMVTNRGWNEADIVLLSKQSAEKFEEIFESIEDRRLSSIVKFALSLGNNEGEHHKLVGAAVNEALRRIAAKSPLRKRRVASFGVKLD